MISKREWLKHLGFTTAAAIAEVKIKTMIQSNEPSIEQMNEAIGTFMGYKMYNKRYPRNHGIGAPEREPEKCMIIQKAKYHTSWYWLMPVWYKFRDLKFTEETAMKLHLNYVARLAQDISYGTIEEFHHNLNIAIKWYNQQKQ